MTPGGRRLRLGVMLALAWLLGLAAAASPPSPPAPPSPPPAQGRRLALVVGVGSFQDPAFEPLRYAVADARRVAAYLTDPKGGGFSPRQVAVLIDRQATRANILAQAERLVRKARPADLVFVYFSTHGFFTRERVMGIVCYDSHATGERGPFGPVVAGDSVLTRKDLYRLLRRLPAQRRAVVLDTCHGAAATGGLASLPRDDSAGYPPESDLEAGPDPAAGTGAGEDGVTLILASCLGRQKAWESRELGASIFTYYLLQGLRRLGGDLVQAFFYSQERTSRQATVEKGWCQTPYMIHLPPWRRLVLAPPGKG